MKYLGATISLLFFLPSVCLGQVVISEIMYDLPGTDTGREWIELQNTSGSSIDLASWKLFEANTNHALTQSQGSTSLSPGGFIVVADDPIKFKTDWPNFAGAILNSSFSLSNEGESLAIKNGDVVVDQITYASSMGATGDGKSLVRSGSTFISATPTPGASNPTTSTSDSSSGTSNSAQSSTDMTSTQSGNTPASAHTSVASSGTISSPIVPQIYADAGEDKNGVVGASILLSGKAYGLKKEPLTNPRLIWNFGDGATAEGTSVLHTYTLPGTYGVFLDVASGEYSASDKTVVTIVPATLTISNVVLGDSGYITISNGSPVDLDLSRWYLRDGSVLFLLPSHTVVSARGALTIPNSVSKLFVTNSGVELLYPNGEVEYHFTQPTASQSPTQTPVIATKPTVLKKTVASKKAVSIASTPLNNSQMAGVAASEAPARGARSEVLSVTRKSDSVALWMLGLSGFIGAVFFGMWFVHKKSLVELSEAKLEGGEEEDEEEFEIIP